MSQIKGATARRIACLSLAAGLMSGCASNVQRSEPLQPESPEVAPATNSNAGRNAMEVAGACLMPLKAGLLGVPITLVCLPLVPLIAVTTALGEALPGSLSDGTGVPDFAYPNGASPSEHTFGGRGSSYFAYPNSYWGCYRPGCR